MAHPTTKTLHQRNTDSWAPSMGNGAMWTQPGGLLLKPRRLTRCPAVCAAISPLEVLPQPPLLPLPLTHSAPQTHLAPSCLGVSTPAVLSAGNVFPWTPARLTPSLPSQWDDPDHPLKCCSPQNSHFPFPCYYFPNYLVQSTLLHIFLVSIIILSPFRT